MKPIFVSIVGTQVMGTLQPWLAFESENPGGSAVLLASEKSRESADRLAAYASEHGFGEIIVRTVSLSSQKDEGARAAVEEIAQYAAQHDSVVWFNLDGGLNYLIACCAMDLMPYDPQYVVSSEYRTLRLDARGDNAYLMSRPVQLPLEDLIYLQGITYGHAEHAGKLVEFCRNSDIDLPSDRLEDVTFDGFDFDLVWNDGTNHLNFMRDMRFQSEDRKVRLADERSFTSWASDRRKSGQIYDRTIYAVVQSHDAAEHLRKESKGKVDVWDLSDFKAPKDSPLRYRYGAELRRLFRELFERSLADDKPRALAAPKKKPSWTIKDGTLVVSVGTNIVPTLSSICSHAPKHLVLCYTKGVQAVADMAANMEKEAESFGLESVCLLPITIEGSFLEQQLPQIEDGARVAVNVSPGSKGQGAMLACWAMRHGATVWSLNSKAGCCSLIGGESSGERIPLASCDLDLRFRIEGIRLKEKGSSLADLEFKFPLYHGLLEFFRAAMEENKADLVMKETCSAAGMELCKVSRELWELHKDGEVFPITLKGGEWLEDLAAVALADAGADAVRSRVRFAWPEEYAEEIKLRMRELVYQGVLTEEEAKDPFMMDLDTIGLMKGDVIVVSCKSNPYDKIEAPAEEVSATGEMLGRFSLRMLLHMGCREARMYGDNVMIFGWRELCHPEDLRGLIDQLRRSQQTTGER